MSHRKPSLHALTLTAAASTAAALLLASSVHAQTGTQTYNGNGGTGFGGTLGNGSLKITSTTSAVSFTLNPSGTFTNNDVVVYIDSKAGGVSSTATFTDNGDNGRTVISGYNAGKPSRSLLTFPTGFTADYALEFENNSYIGFFDLSTPTNFGYITGGAPASGGPYTQTITDAQLGLAPGSSFKFVASLISTDAYRSNETIGTSTTTPETGSAPNAGYTGSTTISAFSTYVTASAAPEPGDLALLTFGASLLSGVFVARRRHAAK